MSLELARLSRRLDALEGARTGGRSPSQAGASPAPPGSTEPPASQAEPGAATPPPGRTIDPYLASEVGTEGEALTSEGSREPPAGVDATSTKSRRGGAPALPTLDIASWNWEWLVGGNWLARIGIVALIFGVAFFISLAIDRGWLGETERVILGTLAGLSLLAAGEFWRKRYPPWAQTVAGGGLAILYLSVYGAFALYELIPPVSAFAAFSLITVAGAMLSLRHESVAIAVFSIFGGFATPLMLQERLPDQRLLLAYVLVLDLGVLGLSAFRNWRWFNLLALLGSLVLFEFWREELDPSTGLAQVGITAIFLVFTGATVAFNLLWKRAGRVFDLALITMNAAAFYGVSYSLIFDPYRPWMGAFTVGVAAFYALISAACRLRGEEQWNLSVFAAGLATVFAVLAVPVQLGGPWISAAWALEGLVLVGMSFPLRMRELRWFGYVMFLVSAVWLLAWDTPGALGSDLTPFLNEYIFSYGTAVVLPAAAAWLLHMRLRELEPREKAAIPALALCSAIFAASLVPVQLQGTWIPVTWAVESVLLLWLSTTLRMRELRWLGFGLLGATVVRLLGWETFGIDAETFRPVVNWRFLAFSAGIAALYVASWLENRRVDDLPFAISPAEQQATLPTLLTVANLATLWLLSAEVIASADSAMFDLSADASANVASLGLSMLWAVYAAGLISLGVARRWRWVRVGGLALLAVPVIKLFAIDSSMLEQEYRVIAFLALGLLLVAGGLLYQRYSRVVRGFLFE